MRLLIKAPARAIGRLCSSLLLVLLLCGFLFFSPTWEKINHDIERKYPQVPSITTDQFRKEIAKGDAPVILDVRSQKEYAVSHLPGAIHQQQPSEIRLPKDTSIVVYCSVGVRSAAFAASLLGRGYTRVVNLKGSIFEWANKGYPLVRGRNEPVTVVHPYDKTWGKLLNVKLQQYEPN